MSPTHDNSELLADAVPSLLALASRIERSRLFDLTHETVDDVSQALSRHLMPVVEAIRAGNPGLQSELQRILDPYTRRGQMQSRLISQPQGYAGDYLTLDWIYQQPYEGSVHDDVWNRFCYQQQASRAVRSRIHIVRDLVASVIRRSDGPVRLLDIASGPGRIERNVVDLLGPRTQHVHFDLIDADGDAVEYSRALLADEIPPGYSFAIRQKNAFRFDPTVPYDAIWSCGLFDYLHDALATRLLARMYTWLKPGGMLLVGNFAKECATQWIMEGLYGWKLIYRSNDECRQLCYEARLPVDCVALERDQTGSVVLISVQKPTLSQ